MPYPVLDISSWPVISQEARGIDAKDWVVPPKEVTSPGQAHWWLYKPIKRAGYRRFDDWSEKLAAELARMLDLPAAHVELAQGVDSTGIVSRNVTPDRWSLESGDTVLSERPGYISCAGDDRPSNRVGHNLANITEALSGAGGPPDSSVAHWTAPEVFVGFLVFDAWIANTDRHAINWAVLTSEVDGRVALAASFDHGTALASGSQDAHLGRITVEEFARRGRAGRFENGRHKELVDLGLEAVDLVQGRARTWLDRLGALRRSQWQEQIDLVPDMSVLRRRFLDELLVINQRRLLS